MPTVLIITKSDDHAGIQRTIEALERKGARTIRFDTDRFPTELDLTLAYGAPSDRIMLRTADGVIDLQQVDSVYYRRADYGARLPADMDRQMRAAATEEARRTVHGLLATMPAFHLDPVARIREAENKPYQLQVAARVGLTIPRTIFTNDPEEVKSFASLCGGKIITKMMSSFAVYESGREQVVFTTPVSAADLDDLDGLRLCPMTFQEHIEKEVEFRVTIVGTRIFSSAIDTRQSNVAGVDWRRDGLGFIDSWVPRDLPDEVAQKLLRLMDVLGLQYGAADVLLTPDGRYVFLEVNPAGEYFWLDDQREVRISDTLAEVLLGNHRRPVA